MKRTISILAVLLVSGGMALAATAGQGSAFNQDFDRFYAAYRVALFATNQGDPAKAQRALATLQQQWNGPMAPYRANAPAPYAGDAHWAASVERVGGLIAAAVQAARSGAPHKGHELLEGVRDEWSAVRKRNQVIVFSDHVNEYHAAMEHALSVGAGTLDAAALSALRDSAAILDYLVDQLRDNAPAPYAANPEFGQALAANAQAIDALYAALRSGDTEAVATAAAALKKPFARLFLKFG